jgi:hypothetical protein
MISVLDVRRPTQGSLAAMAEKLVATLTDGSEHEVVIPDDSSPAEMLAKLTGHMRGAEWIDVVGQARIRTSAVISVRVAPDSRPV